MTETICYLCHKEKPCETVEAPAPDGKITPIQMCEECRTRIKKERETAKANMQKLKARCEELGLPSYPAVHQTNAFCQTWWDVGNELALMGYSPEEISKTAIVATGYLVDMIESGMRGVQFAREAQEKQT